MRKTMAQTRMTHLFPFLRSVFAVVCVSALALACEDNRPVVTEINVQAISVDSIPVQNAWVHVFVPGGVGDTTLFNDPTTQGYYWCKTGIDGYIGRWADSAKTEWVPARFKFTGEAYLDVEASKGGWRGCGFIHVLEGGEAEMSIVIHPYGDPNNGCPQ